MMSVKSRMAKLPTSTPHKELLTTARIQLNQGIYHAPSARSL